MRVIVAEDSTLLRQGLVRLLGEAGIDVVGQTDNADDLLVLAAAELPDVVLADIRMPPTYTDEGLRAACELRERHPGMGVLILSQYVETGSAVRGVVGNLKGFGYLLKDRVADIDELVDAIGRVAAGESVMDPEVVARLLNRRRAASSLDDLTGREREVLGLIAEGRSNEAIAQRLGVGGKTVETHVRNIFTKLSLEPSPAGHRRVLAVLAYLQN